MNGIELLKDLRKNARNYNADERPSLISLDIDSHYSSVLPPKFLTEYTNFLDLSRQFFNVVHVCHNFRKAYTANRPRTGTVRPYAPDDKSHIVFPKTLPREGEYILGKKAFSAFEDTDLADFLPKDKPVLIMGAFGKLRTEDKNIWCIDSTINDGLKAGFNMIAIKDMIANRFARRRYGEHGAVPAIHSHSVSKSLILNAAPEQDNSPLSMPMALSASNTDHHQPA